MAAMGVLASEIVPALVAEEDAAWVVLARVAVTLRVSPVAELRAGTQLTPDIFYGLAV